MRKKKDSSLTPEQQEKLDIEWENKMLRILLPSVGGAAFVIGLVGFILTIAVNPGVGVFFLILAILGVGGIVYGLIALIKKKRNKYRKEETVPSEEPNAPKAK